MKPERSRWTGIPYQQAALGLAAALALALAAAPAGAAPLPAPVAGAAAPAITTGTTPATAGSASTASTSTAARDPLDAVMALLGAQRHAQVRFNQRQYLSLLDRPLLSSGELRYDAPDRLEQQIVQPRPQTLVYEAGQLTVERGRRRYRFDARHYPQLLPLLESLRATLAGDRAALQHTFHLDFQGTTAHWSLQLVPLDAGPAALVRSIHIDGERGQLRRIELRQANGDHSTLYLQPDESPVTPRHGP